MESNKDILLKAWELTQSIAKNNAETAWKVRMWGITIWSALIGYGYNSNTPFIITISIMVLFPLFLFECGIRVIEYKMIYRSHEIEDSLNSILKKSDPILPSGGVRIDISETSLKDLSDIIILKRWLIWGPYVCLVIISLIAQCTL